MILYERKYQEMNSQIEEYKQTMKTDHEKSAQLALENKKLHDKDVENQRAVTQLEE